MQGTGVGWVGNMDARYRCRVGGEHGTGTGVGWVGNMDARYRCRVGGEHVTKLRLYRYV